MYFNGGDRYVPQEAGGGCLRIRISDVGENVKNVGKFDKKTVVTEFN
jgi:hypothetical protein